MTVSSSTSKIAYGGNGSTTVFSFSFSSPATSSDISVYFTDALGNVTLLSPTVYTLVFNPPVTGNPTPIGGSVTYNPGSPIPIGTTLTIVRQLPLVQGTSLSNQAAFFQQTIEGALDYVTMAIQQVVQGVSTQAIVVPVTDPQPNPLPSVAQRANLIMGFDNNGNPIATNSIPGGGSISSAMAPVCAGATLVTARANMGLGNTAVEAIGSGLEDDGSGNLIVNQSVTTLSSGTTSFSVTKANHLQSIIYTRATGTTFALAASSSYFNGFNFNISQAVAASAAPGSQITIQAGDSFYGMPTGQSYTIPGGTGVNISTNGAGIWYINFNGRVPNYAVIDNYTIVSSVNAGALTIALKDVNGNDPSFASPIRIGFGGGGPTAFTQSTITAPTSITIPLGATLGTKNNVPLRLWVGLFTGGILGVYISVTQSAAQAPSSIAAWDESRQYTPSTVNAGSTNPQTWYASSSPVNANLRVIGYLEFSFGLPAAGNWSLAPSITQLFAQGNRKPGDVVQEAQALGVSSNTASATYAVFTGAEFTNFFQSLCDVWRVEMHGSVSLTVASTGSVRLSRGNTNNTNMIGSEEVIQVSGAAQIPFSVCAYDIPAINGNITYSLQGLTSAGTITANTNILMVVKEIFV
jgi:hypothetical protein